MTARTRISQDKPSRRALHALRESMPAVFWLDQPGAGFTQLQMVRSRPLPFPPEPLRLPLIEMTRRSTARAELNGGRRNLWLRTLDRFGVGFDS